MTSSNGNAVRRRRNTSPNLGCTSARLRACSAMQNKAPSTALVDAGSERRLGNAEETYRCMALRGAFRIARGNREEASRRLRCIDAVSICHGCRRSNEAAVQVPQRCRSSGRLLKKNAATPPPPCSTEKRGPLALTESHQTWLGGRQHEGRLQADLRVLVRRRCSSSPAIRSQSPIKESENAND
jgi:hypothetical protein